MPGATAAATRTQTESLETSLGGLDADFVLQALVRALRVVPFGRVSEVREPLQAGRTCPAAPSPSEDVYGPLQTGSRSERDPCGQKSSGNARRPSSTCPTNRVQRLTELNSHDEGDGDHSGTPTAPLEPPGAEIREDWSEWDASRCDSGPSRAYFGVCGL